jgi:hypothetical protein
MKKFGVAIMIDVIDLNTYTIEALFVHPIKVPIGTEIINAKNTDSSM